MWEAARPGGVLAVEDADLVRRCVCCRAIADSIVSAGLATAAEVTAAIEDLRAFTADPDTLVSDPRIFQVWARRGADNTPAVR